LPQQTYSMLARVSSPLGFDHHKGRRGNIYAEKWLAPALTSYDSSWACSDKLCFVMDRCRKSKIPDDECLDQWPHIMNVWAVSPRRWMSGSTTRHLSFPVLAISAS